MPRHNNLSVLEPEPAPIDFPVTPTGPLPTLDEGSRRMLDELDLLKPVADAKAEDPNLPAADRRRWARLAKSGQRLKAQIHRARVRAGLPTYRPERPTLEAGKPRGA